MSGTTDLLDEAGIALGAGDIETALPRLTAAIELEDPPLAHVLLGAIAYIDDRSPKRARGVGARVLGLCAAPVSCGPAALVAIDLAELQRTPSATPRPATAG